MRKLLALMMSVLLMLGIAACGNTSPQNGDLFDTGDGSAAQTTSDTADRPEETVSSKVMGAAVTEWLRFFEF